MIDRFERFSLYITEISQYWHKITTAEMAKYGLKGAHSMYLCAMARYPEGVTATQLGELCGKDKSDVSRMMSIMEKKGLVSKEGVHQNLYRGVFKLTDAGKAAADYVTRRATLAVQLAGRDLTEEMRCVLYESLGSIAANLEQISIEGLPADESSQKEKTT